MQTLFVGVDVSLHTNEVVGLVQDGTEVCSFRAHNTKPGTAVLIEQLTGVLQSRQLNRVVIGLESTGMYGWHLEQKLRSAPALDPFTPVVHPFNPKVVAGFKKAYPELPKTDKVDAWVIADRLRFGRLPASVALDDRHMALRRLTRLRLTLVQDLARARQRFQASLFLKFSAFAQNNPFSDPLGATALALTASDLLPEELAMASIEELTAQIIRHGKNRFADPEAVAAAVQKAARASYRLPQAMADPVNLELATHLAVIRTLQAQIKTLEAPITHVFTTIPNTLQSVPGIGPVFAAGILAEIGDIRRFPNHNALAKYAGLAWSRHQSGKFEADDTSLIRTGNRHLRYYLVQAAFTVSVHDAEFKRYYQLKKAETKKHAHKRALVLTARKLVRLVDCLLRSHRLYNPLGAPRRTA